MVLIVLGCSALLQAGLAPVDMLTDEATGQLVLQVEDYIAAGDVAGIEQVCEQLARRSLQIEEVKKDAPCWTHFFLGVATASAFLGGVYLYQNLEKSPSEKIDGDNNNDVGQTNASLPHPEGCGCAHHNHSHEHAIHKPLAVAFCLSSGIDDNGKN